jgi:hypothetical protein
MRLNNAFSVAVKRLERLLEARIPMGTMYGMRQR